MSIYVIVFGLTFAVMLALTFLPPVVLSGLIFFSLVLARATVPTT